MAKVRLLLVSFLVSTLVLGTAVAGFAGPKAKAPRPFKDLDEAAWALPDITKMKAMDVVKGYDDGTFRPMASINRQDAVIMAVRLAGFEAAAEDEEDAQLPFRDAEQISDYAKGFVAVAYEKGWLDSLFPNPEADKFQPHKAASRLWVTVLLVNALGKAEDARALTDATLNFKDANSIPQEFVNYVAEAVALGIIKGFDDQTFQPNKPVTRAEMAAMLSRTDGNWSLVTGKKRSDEVKGTVTSVVYNEITLQTDENATITVTFSPDVSIFIDRNEATWEEIKAGDEAKIKLDSQGLALFIEIERQDQEEAQEQEAEQQGEQGEHEETEYEGTVVAITPPSGDTAGTIQIDTDEGRMEFALPADVKVEGDKGLSDLEVGMIVELEVSGNTVIKLAVEE